MAGGAGSRGSRLGGGRLELGWRSIGSEGAGDAMTSVENVLRRGDV